MMILAGFEAFLCLFTETVVFPKSLCWRSTSSAASGVLLKELIVLFNKTTGSESGCSGSELNDGSTFRIFGFVSCCCGTSGWGVSSPVIATIHGCGSAINCLGCEDIASHCCVCWCGITSDVCSKLRNIILGVGTVSLVSSDICSVVCADICLLTFCTESGVVVSAYAVGAMSAGAAFDEEFIKIKSDVSMSARSAGSDSMS